MVEIETMGSAIFVVATPTKVQVGVRLLYQGRFWQQSRNWSCGGINLGLETFNLALPYYNSCGGNRIGCTTTSCVDVTVDRGDIVVSLEGCNVGGHS